MENIEKNLVFIPVEQLYPHPENPRKELGDLAELADSIKVKGVMQNLTVVPGHRMTDDEWHTINAEYKAQPSEELRHRINNRKCEDGFTVIIGHRRLAAAKLAGLVNLPCIIETLTPQEQIQTMLLENLLREDLTIYEQAQGFQMMLDFGDSIDQVSEKTGFSKSTIRKRVKMAELNKETFKNVSGRQFNLADIERLNQIEDIDVRNDVLAQIGTKNFENRLLDAMNKQKKAKLKAGWEAIFAEYGMTEIPYRECWDNKYVSADSEHSYLTGEPNKEVVAELAKLGVPLYFAWSYNGDTPYIRTDRIVTAEEEAEQERKEEAAAERRAKSDRLREIEERAFELRRNFIKNFSLPDCKKSMGKVCEWANIREIARFANNSWFSVYSSANNGKSMFEFLYGIESIENSNYEAIKEQVEQHPERSLLYHTYSLWCDGAIGCHDWNRKYQRNEKLEAIYAGLESLGYDTSDEEIAMIDGSLPEYADFDFSIEEDDSVPEATDEEISDDEFDDELAEMMEEDEE